MNSLFQAAYVHFQTEISSYGAIYGSFAALPLFLLWLNISWLIVLFGAELAFTFQNSKALTDQSMADQLSSYSKKHWCLFIMQSILKTFKAGDGALTLDKLQHPQLPHKALVDCLQSLIKAGLIQEIKQGSTFAYLPTQPVENFSLDFTLHSLEHTGETLLPSLEGQPYSKHIYENETLSKEHQKKLHLLDL